MKLNLKKHETYTLRVTVTPNLLEGVKGDREKAAKDIAASYVAHELHDDFDISKEEMASLARQMFEERGMLDLRADGSIMVTLLMENEIELADISEYYKKKMINMKEI